MTTFVEYLKRPKPTRRKSITHLDKMSPVAFLEMTEGWQRQLRVPISLKVDGAGIRFGKDHEGEFFFESSNSGPVYDPEAFTRYAKENGKSMARAEAYAKMFALIQNSGLWKILPANTKVITEALYNALATITEEGKATFVKIPYDRSKLGNSLTIFPIALLDIENEDDTDPNKILERLCSYNDDDIKVINPHLGTFIIDVTKELFELNLVCKQVLRSRRAEDAALKEQHIAIIRKVQNELTSRILSARFDNDMIGPVIEGYVLDLPNCKLKVTTPEFRATFQP
ncbi:MAG: hypothetical protein QXN55_00110 [Candidatus Nitrosotenuis sp.]